MDNVTREARRLLSTPPEEWTSEDLSASEAVQRQLTAHDFPMLDVARIRNRHRQAADRMLRAERSPAALVQVAQRIIGHGATRLQVITATERIERSIRIAVSQAGAR